MRQSLSNQTRAFRYLVPLVAGALFVAAPGFAAQDKMQNDKMQGDKMMARTMGRTHTTGTFAGIKVNGGTVSHFKQGRLNILALSDDFPIPDSPAPHWQVVDSRGNVYLLPQLKIKGGKMN